MVNVQEHLEELEVKLQRLKIEYEQYFSGALKREPRMLRGDVQRLINRYINAPPTNARHKFKFNGLCSRFHAYRQLWERTMRQIDDGTYERHVFRADLHDRERGKNGSRPAARKKTGKAGGKERASPEIEKLYDALSAARRRTGEGIGNLTPRGLAKIVARQVAGLRRRNPSGKVRFEVVVEDRKAKLRASVDR